MVVHVAGTLASRQPALLAPTRRIAAPAPPCRSLKMRPMRVAPARRQLARERGGMTVSAVGPQEMSEVASLVPLARFIPLAARYLMSFGLLWATTNWWYYRRSRQDAEKWLEKHKDDKPKRQAKVDKLNPRSPPSGSKSRDD